MILDDNGQMISKDKFPDIHLITDKNHRKNLNQETDLTGNGTRARWMKVTYHPQQWNTAPH